MGARPSVLHAASLGRSLVAGFQFRLPLFGWLNVRVAVPSAERLDKLCAITDRKVWTSRNTEVTISRLRTVLDEGAEQMVPDHSEQAEIDIALDLVSEVMVAMPRRDGPEVDQWTDAHVRVGM
ncbi:MAG: hypothetical protein AAF720_13295, partial [Pseudomonadota bacterium]